MDWEKIDLTLEGHIGDEAHPNKPWHMRESRHWDLYMDVFDTDRNGMFQIIRNERDLSSDPAGFKKEREAQEEDNVANSFMCFFGKFPE